MTSVATIASPPVPLSAQRQSLLKAALYMVLASAVLMPHFIMCAIFGPGGFIGIFAATLAGMVVNLEFGFALLVVCLFLQNLFIAAVTPITPTLDQFTPMLATSFVNIILTTGICAYIWMRARRELPSDNTGLMRWMIFFFAVIVVYSALGAVKASPQDAATYMRVYLVGGFMLTMGIAFGLKISSAYAISVFRVMTFILVLWGFLEFFMTYELYAIFHVADYMRMKYATDILSTFYSIQETINFASRSYLNLSGALGLNMDLLRPMGPNMHPISYAYALSFGAIVCYVYRSNLLLAGCLIILALIGAKGPLIMAFLAVALGTFYQFARFPKALLFILVTCLVFYVAVGLAYGSYTEDYHVVGFWGGVKGFLSNPIGYGVGVGGNLSTLAATRTNFSLFQGYGASFALESGFGVMLYQIGVGTAVFLAFYWKLWRCVWKATMFFSNEPRLVAIPCALGILLVNSVFQEEAFSPAGWGPLLMLSGLLLANYWRAQPTVLLAAESSVR